MRKFILLALCACASGAFASVYSVDDGSAENSIGLQGGGAISWGNQFTVEAGGENITDVMVSWDRNGVAGNMSPNGTAITISLWQDMDGNGNPNDLFLLSSMNSTISNSGLPGFVSYDIDDVTMTAGQSFFVSVSMNQAPTDMPASWDSNGPRLGRSWITVGSTFGAAGATFNINDTSSLTGLEGNWLIRANASPVPEPATMAVLGAGALALIRKRRKK